MSKVIDPPSGWKYGFPKAVPDEILEDHTALAEWLIEEGYPIEDLDQAMKYSRILTFPDGDDNAD